MIGLVQIGQQSMADRYTYIPAVGIFLAVGFLLAELARHSITRRRLVLAFAGMLLASWGILAHAQAATWRNSVTLWGHALRVTRANHLAHNNLGMAYIARGDLDLGYQEFKTAVAIKPNYAEALSNLGNAARTAVRLPKPSAIAAGDRSRADDGIHDSTWRRRSSRP